MSVGNQNTEQLQQIKDAVIGYIEAIDEFRKYDGIKANTLLIVVIAKRRVLRDLLNMPTTPIEDWWASE